MTTTDSILIDSRGVEITYNGFTGHYGIGEQLAALWTTQTPVTRIAVASYTLKRMAIFISTNTATSSVATFHSFVAAANGNQSVAIDNGTSPFTGWNTDSTHTDSITSTTKVNGQFTYAGSPTIKITQTAFTFENTSPLAGFAWGDTSSANSALTASCFLPLCGDRGTSVLTTEDHKSQIVLRAGGTSKGLQAYCGGTVGASATITTRKNTGAGNQSVTLSANSNTQDSTHTDTYSAGDTADYKHTIGGVTNTALWWVGTDFAGTSSAQDMVASAESSDTGASVTTSDAFAAISSNLGWWSTETNAKSTIWYAVTASRLRIDIQTNTESNTTSIKTRNNGADGNQSLSITAAATGSVEDSTHTDSITAANTLNYRFASNAGTGTITPNWMALTLDDGSVLGGSTETSSGSMDFSGISITANGNIHHASGVMAFTGISIPGVGTGQNAATSVLTLSGPSITATGTGQNISTGTMALSGISFVARGRKVKASRVTIAIMT